MADTRTRSHMRPLLRRALRRGGVVLVAALALRLTAYGCAGKGASVKMPTLVVTSFATLDGAQPDQPRIRLRFSRPAVAKTEVGKPLSDPPVATAALQSGCPRRAAPGTVGRETATQTLAIQELRVVGWPSGHGLGGKCHVRPEEKKRVNAVANGAAIAQFSCCSYDSTRDLRSRWPSRTDRNGPARPSILYSPH